MGRTVTLTRPSAAKAKTTLAKPKNGHPSKDSKIVPGPMGIVPPRLTLKSLPQVRTFKSALDYLNHLPNYERRSMTARDRGNFTLSRIKRILTDLDQPHKAYRSAHIAGTKGKGSTATMLARMLQANHMKVGLYTSPHIIDVRERITINGEMISEAAFAKTAARVAHVVEKAKADIPTYFEFLTALAFQYFKDQKIDMAVVETGLGGRLDATNVLKPEVCGITSISYDHMAVLGSTLEDIATEKSGIMKEHVPVVSAPQSRNVKMALKKAAEKINAPLIIAGEDIEFSYRFESSRALGPQARICITTPTSHFDHLPVPLVGEHQAVNCGVAIGMLDQLKSRGFRIDDEASVSGLAKVSLEGRMEMLCTQPRVITDGAHNASSVEALMRAIGQNIQYDSMVVIFGCCSDKDVEGMMRLIQLGADKVIFTNIQSPRSSTAADLAAKFVEVSGRMAQTAPTLTDAMVIAEKAITRDDLICITGSFHLVAEAKQLFADHPHRAASKTSPV
ncbi:MAG: folylpolyglutamate synthase/dihydrofolate synthase family protein [Planctomycetota bacterium]